MSNAEGPNKLRIDEKQTTMKILAAEITCNDTNEDTLSNKKREE